MISKMKPAKEGGTRLAIVFNGSPLFTGSAGSGESNIRQWIIENDWLEAIAALPDQLFYNTGISTYLWIVTNRKEKARRGKIQLIDATNFFVKMRKSLAIKEMRLETVQTANPIKLPRLHDCMGILNLESTSKFLRILILVISGSRSSVPYGLISPQTKNAWPECGRQALRKSCVK